MSTVDPEDVIVVGATHYVDGQDKASFSNYGKAIDVVAPGTSIYTTTKDGGYSPRAGTSYSAPIVNGVVGMIWAANPSLTPDEVKSILFSTTDDLGDAGEDNTFGWGRVNVYKAVQKALGTDSGSDTTSCAHDLCSTGDDLLSSCDPCVTKICAQDPFCCGSGWDNLCVEEVGTICGTSCGQ